MLRTRKKIQANGMLKATRKRFASISHHNVEIFLETITSHRYEIIIVHTLATARYNYNSYEHSCTSL